MLISVDGRLFGEIAFSALTSRDVATSACFLARLLLYLRATSAITLCNCATFRLRDFGSKFVRIQALVTPPYGIRVDQVRANSDIANTPVAAIPDKVRSECQNCSFCQHAGEKTPAW
jgi:hypothetical protein